VQVCVVFCSPGVRGVSYTQSVKSAVQCRCDRCVVFCSPGVCGVVCCTAQVNPNMPRTFGDGVIHKSHFDALVEVDHPLPEIHTAPATETEDKIGQFIADNLVMDGATLQMGLYFCNIAAVCHLL